MTVSFEDLAVKKLAMVRGCFGTEKAKEVFITEVDEDIKNGEAGICYSTPDGASGWAYIDQIDSVYSAESMPNIRRKFIEHASSCGAVEVDGKLYANPPLSADNDFRLDTTGLIVSVRALDFFNDDVAWCDDKLCFVITELDDSKYTIKFYNLVPYGE